MVKLDYELWPCDPNKNTQCRGRDMCLKIGPRECRHTRHREFSIDGSRPMSEVAIGPDEREPRNAAGGT